MSYVFDYDGIRFVKQAFTEASERKWFREEPNMALTDAVVLRPSGRKLSEEAVNTIRHFRYYLNGKRGVVLFSDTVVAEIDAGSFDDMITAAHREASAVLSSMPDFVPYDMDDGCGLLRMCNADVYAFRNYSLPTGAGNSIGHLLSLRAECMEACDDFNIVAIVYNDREEFERNNTEYDRPGDGEACDDCDIVEVENNDGEEVESITLRTTRPEDEWECLEIRDDCDIVEVENNDGEEFERDNIADGRPKDEEGARTRKAASPPETALAEGDATGIALGAGAITPGNRVYFGSYEEKPILWRVLRNGSEKALLLSENILDRVPFNQDDGRFNFDEIFPICNEWANSDAQRWCKDFLANWAEGSVERAAISATTANDTDVPDMGYYDEDDVFITCCFFDEPPLNDEYFFFLSAKEAYVLSADDDDRKASDEDAVCWWLRSACTMSETKAGIYIGGRSLFFVAYVRCSFGARPAFNFKLDSLLFASEIRTRSRSDPKQYKLTLLDKPENLKISIPEGASVARNGASVAVPYTLSGKNATDATKVYAMVTDKPYTDAAAKVLQCTALTPDGDGTGSFELSGDVSGTWGADYRVYVVAVNESGAYNLSDAASAPLEIHAHE